MGPEELSTQHQASKQQGILRVGGCEGGDEEGGVASLLPSIRNRSTQM